MNTDKFIKILERFSSSQATDEEKIIVEEYFDKKYLRSVDPLQLDSEAKSILLNRIEESTTRVKNVKLLHRFSYGYGIVASIILALGLFVFLQFRYEPKLNIVQTAYGEKQEVVLPDGSIVMLNSGSSIEFPEKFNINFREVVLKGEAFFKVQRDITRPFLVETDQLITEVLGTSFNINSFSEKDSISVSVATGKVLVHNKDNLKEVLLPNHQLHYHKTTHGYRRSSNKSSIDAAWASNTIHLNNRTLKEAIDILEKWFDVSIKVSNPSLAEVKVIGKYHDPDLKQTLESLSFLLDIEFIEKSKSKYIIISKKE